MNKISIFIIMIGSLAPYLLIGQNNKWTLQPERGIVFKVDTSQVLSLNDNIEMAGRKVAGIISYKIGQEGQLQIDRDIIFPQLHPFISEDQNKWANYRAYLRHNYEDNEINPKIYLNEKAFVPGIVKDVSINGLLTITHKESLSGLQLTRTFYPSMSERLFIEEWALKNLTEKEIKLSFNNISTKYESQGAKGNFIQMVETSLPKTLTIIPGGKYNFEIKYSAKIDAEISQEYQKFEAKKTRDSFLKKMSSSLQFNSPNSTLDQLFEFSKIRSSESIFDSELGMIHSPGGGRYYVGIWANDQAEYVSPFFPFITYEPGMMSAINCYNAFSNELSSSFEPIRYSFEIEGLVDAIYLDRGDAAMIAYGASQFALYSGEQEILDQVWPLIEWCLEYCHRKLNRSGVVRSDSDEMEGRIETGSANLSTSALYFGALGLAIDICKSGENKVGALKYNQRQKSLNIAIEEYFGANLEGLETYKYYEEHQALRHWICLPLVVGIKERTQATTDALFEKLWSDNGIHVEKHNPNKRISEIFWDRGTLYALRGTFIAGDTDRSLNRLEQFSTERLLGNRVPYVIEAFPEGAMAHLSAESGLYCRVITEGMFGIYPTSLKSFKCTPRLPSSWDFMELNYIKAFDENFDIKLKRDGAVINVEVIDHKKNTIKRFKLDEKHKSFDYWF